MPYKGSNSALTIGFIDKSYHYLNYTETAFKVGDEYEQSFNSFPAFEVKIGNFSLRATHAPTLNVKAVIDVQFPLILIQATNALEHEYYQGNLTALAGDVLFR
jgi:hypothetical protein